MGSWKGVIRQMNINEEITDNRVFAQYYILRDGYEFKPLTHPANIYDAIVIKNPPDAFCVSFKSLMTGHSLSEQIELVNQLKIEKAIIVAVDISFITQCSSLRHLKIIPEDCAGDNFDFSPLYKMSEVKSLSCRNQYGNREQFLSEIDYSRIHGLVNLGVSVNKGTLNFNKVETLKSLAVSAFKGKKHDLTDLFCSKELDTLRMVQCGIHSINGIETSKKMQCLYLHYNHYLQDISALRKVKETLKALRIENCPKIEDFSVLSELENLELLELSGSNVLPNLNFLRSMKSLKTFTFSMNVLDGDLTPCLNISYVYSEKDRKHFNLKDKDLPKVNYMRGNENIEEWRRLE
jgi:hypothetical protein